MTENSDLTEQSDIEEKPPFGKSWNSLYGIVILNHLVLIIIFFILTSVLA